MALSRSACILIFAGVSPYILPSLSMDLPTPKALLAAQHAAHAQQEAEVQVEEAKRSVGKQFLILMRF